MRTSVLLFCLVVLVLGFAVSVAFAQNDSEGCPLEGWGSPWPEGSVVTSPEGQKAKCIAGVWQPFEDESLLQFYGIGFVWTQDPIIDDTREVFDPELGTYTDVYDIRIASDFAFTGEACGWLEVSSLPTRQVNFGLTGVYFDSVVQNGVFVYGDFVVEAEVLITVYTQCPWLDELKSFQ